jgi:hypothetical protein
VSFPPPAPCTVSQSKFRSPSIRRREPANPYGASNLPFENALEAYSRAYGLRSVSLRYFNAAGADESGEIGEKHAPETHLIPLALADSTENGLELQIYGSDYPTADGTCLREEEDSFPTKKKPGGWARFRKRRLRCVYIARRGWFREWRTWFTSACSSRASKVFKGARKHA